jgi:putative tricarboxylic transport membrane protein
MKTSWQRVVRLCNASLLGAIAFIAVLMQAPAQAQEWKPSRSLEWIVPSGAGAALDMAARQIRDAADRSGRLDQPFLVQNRPGGSNLIALNTLVQNPGNAHYVATFNHGQINNRLLGVLPVGYADFTPLAILVEETLVVAVREDSPIRSAKDLVERLRKDPGSLSIGIATSAGNHIHVAIALPLRKAGVDVSQLRIVPYKSSAASMTDMLGGHIDVVSASTPNVVALHQAGRIRLIAVATAERLAGTLASVPTWREQGVDAVYHSAQGVLGPRGLSPEQIQFWENLLRDAAKSEGWQKLVARNHWRPTFLTGAEARAYLDAQNEEARAVLGAIGLLKK